MTKILVLFSSSGEKVADDLCEQNFLENLIPFFENENVVMSYTQSKQINEDGDIIASDYTIYTDDVGDYWADDYTVDGLTEIKRALCIKNTIPNVSAALFDRITLLKVIHENFESITKLKVAGDWLIYLHMALIGSISFCQKSLNLHRRHTSSVTRVNDHLHEVIYIQNLCNKLVNLDLKQKEIMENYILKLREHFSNLKNK
jgi:hypothetical protein